MAAERRRAQWRAYYVRHRDEIRARRLGSAAQQRAKRVWIAKQSPARQRLLAQVANANRTAKSAGVAGRISLADVEFLPSTCTYCGSSTQVEVDHATPMSRGGENHWSNLTTACRTCNARKRTRTVAEFRDRMVA